MDRQEENKQPDHDQEKKIYRRPELSVFGSITSVTKSNANGPSSDNGNNAMGS